jgi:hypothetical protein
MEEVEYIVGNNSAEVSGTGYRTWYGVQVFTVAENGESLNTAVSAINLNISIFRVWRGSQMNSGEELGEDSCDSFGPLAI